MQDQLLRIEVFLLKKYLTVKIITMAKIKITQIRSAIKKPKRQKDTLIALGFYVLLSDHLGSQVHPEIFLNKFLGTL